jgi:hypothetical protein
MLSTSAAQQLALDADPDATVREAQRHHARVKRERLAVERERWTPRRKHRLATAERREAGASVTLARALRVAGEHEHGSLPFLTELEIDQQDHERALHVRERVEQRRERSAGRGLEL